jgi:hypothetical protein
MMPFISCSNNNDGLQEVKAIGIIKKPIFKSSYRLKRIHNNNPLYKERKRWLEEKKITQRNCIFFYWQLMSIILNPKNEAPNKAPNEDEVENPFWAIEKYNKLLENGFIKEWQQKFFTNRNHY